MFFKNSNLIDAEINNGSKDYDKKYVMNHVNKLILKFSNSLQSNSKFHNLNFVVLNLNQF